MHRLPDSIMIQPQKAAINNNNEHINRGDNVFEQPETEAATLYRFITKFIHCT